MEIDGQLNMLSASELRLIPFFQPRIKIWKVKDLPITITEFLFFSIHNRLKPISECSHLHRIHRKTAGGWGYAPDPVWRMRSKIAPPDPDIWEELSEMRHFRGAAFWRVSAWGNFTAGLRIDLAQRLPGLEMTWLLYFAGAATCVVVIW